MWQLCELLLNVCFFRRGPQDVPYSKKILWSLLAFNWITSTLLLTKMNPFVNAALIRAAFLWVTLGFIKQILHFRKLPERFVQMSISIIGIDCVLISVMLLSRLIVTPSLFMIMILYVWQFGIYISIFKQGFNLTAGKAVWVVLFFNVLQNFIVFNLIAFFKRSIL